MTKTQMEPFRQQLLGLERRLQSDIDNLADDLLKHGMKSGGFPSNLPAEGSAEPGSAFYDEDVTMDLLDEEGPQLGLVNDALERIAAGTFGSCEVCGQEISLKRLQAIPYARKCVACARRSQQRGVHAQLREQAPF